MILADLVKDVTYGNSKKATKFEEDIRTQVTQFEETANKFLELAETHGDNQMTRNTANVIAELVEKFNLSLSEARNKTNFLDMKIAKPIEKIEFSMYNSNKFKHQIYSPAIFEAPRTKMENIFDVAEKLGLLIIPTKYVNRKVLDKDSYMSDRGYTRGVSDLFDRFTRHTNRNNLQSWLVCPVQYYDIEAHAKDLTYEFFVPSSVRQAFTSIKIILPMLIGMINQIESLNKKVDNMGDELKNIRQTLVQQQQQIDRLQEELAHQRIQIAERAAQERNMMMEFQQLRADVSWDLFDPLLIALPSNVTNINTYDGNVVLGPAWGPEINEVLIDLLGLTKYTERKNYINTEANRY